MMYDVFALCPELLSPIGPFDFPITEIDRIIIEWILVEIINNVGKTYSPPSTVISRLYEDDHEILAYRPGKTTREPDWKVHVRIQADLDHRRSLGAFLSQIWVDGERGLG